MVHIRRHHPVLRWVLVPCRAPHLAIQVMECNRCRMASSLLANSNILLNLQVHRRQFLLRRSTSTDLNLTLHNLNRNNTLTLTLLTGPKVRRLRTKVLAVLNKSAWETAQVDRLPRKCPWVHNALVLGKECRTGRSAIKRSLVPHWALVVATPIHPLVHRIWDPLKGFAVTRNNRDSILSSSSKAAPQTHQPLEVAECPTEWVRTNLP